MKRWKALLLAHCIASYIVFFALFLFAVFVGNDASFLWVFAGLLAVASLSIGLVLIPGLALFAIKLSLVIGLVYVVSISVGYQMLKRRRIRIIRGICMKCGYDLRASNDRCPECGTKVHMLVRWINDEAKKGA